MNINNKNIDMWDHDKYYAENSEKLKEYSKKYYEANKQKVLQKNREKRKDPKLKEKHNQRQRTYYLNKQKLICKIKIDSKKILFKFDKLKLSKVKPTKKVNNIPTASNKATSSIKKENIAHTILQKNNLLEPLKTKNYINAYDFTFELICCKGRGFVSDKLSDMFMLIAKNLTKKNTFSIEDFHYDQIMEAYTDMMSSWWLVNIDKYNANQLFAYFTERAKRSFVKIYNVYTDRTQQNKFNQPKKCSYEFIKY